MHNITGFIKGLVPAIILAFLILSTNNTLAAKLPNGDSIIIKHENKVSAFVSNQVIVKYKPGYSLQDLSNLRNVNVISYEFLPMGYELIHIDGNVLDACSELIESGAVDVAEPNYVRYPQLDPDDIKWPQQFNLILSDAPSGWNINTGSYDVTVAVIDTGVDYNHPDLIENLLTN